MLTLLLSCHTPSDTELYSDGLKEGVPEHCLQIKDKSIAGDCLSALVTQDPQAAHWPTTCEQVSDPQWRGECFFQISDAGMHIGDSARTLCAKADPFSEDCLRHAAARDVEKQVQLGSLNQAQRLMPRIYGILKAYLPDPVAQPMARDMLVRMVAAANPNEPFSAKFCQGLSSDTCSQVYTVRSLGSGQQRDESNDWLTFCDEPILSEKAVKWGWAAYTLDMQSIAEKSWHQVCQGQTRK